MLQGESGVLRKEFDKLIEWTRGEPAPDVIDLPNSLLIAMAAPLKRAFGRPLCCTMQGEEFFINGLVAPYHERALQLIRERVPTVDRFIAVSDYSAGFMSQYLGIPPDRISVVPLGISLEGYPEKSEVRRHKSEVTTIGYFARIAPEKGLHVLVDAYVRLRTRTRDLPIRLRAAGHMPAANQPYLDGVTATLAHVGLGEEFEYRGELDRDAKLSFLRGLDVLSVPATYDEPKGLFLLEAMASGVPVVQPRRGSFTEIVERTGGGRLVVPDDPEALAAELERVVREPALRGELARKAFDGVRRHHTVAQSVDRLLDAYRAAGR